METIELAFNGLRMGRPVIIVEDDADVKTPYLAAAGENLSPEMVNLSADFGSGITYAAVSKEIVERVGLPYVGGDEVGNETLASVDAAEGVTTGISAFDRAHVIRLLAKDGTTMQALTSPGHVFPVAAVPGGVLKRAGVVEAAVDLARLAGFCPVMMLTELVDEDGEVMTREQVTDFAQQHDITMVSVKDLISYRLHKELLVRLVGFETLNSPYGPFKVMVYEDTITGGAHLALVSGQIRPDRPTLVRVHSECLTGDVLHSFRCDCGFQLDEAMKRIAKEGGVLLYLRQEGRGIGLLNKVMAYGLQDSGLDTVEANVALGFGSDMREYGLGAQILYHLGVRKMRLLTNNPKKIVAIGGFGLEVVQREPIEIPPRSENFHYLQTKKQKMGHLLEKV